MGHDTCHSGQGSPAVTYATVHSPHGDGTRVTVAVTYATVHSPHGDVTRVTEAVTYATVHSSHGDVTRVTVAVTYATVHSPHGDGTRVTVAVTYATVYSSHGDYPITLIPWRRYSFTDGRDVQQSTVTPWWWHTCHSGQGQHVPWQGSSDLQYLWLTKLEYLAKPPVPVTDKT